MYITVLLTDFKRPQSIWLPFDDWNKRSVAVVNLVFKFQLWSLNVFGHEKTVVGIFFSWGVFLQVDNKKKAL